MNDNPEQADARPALVDRLGDLLTQGCLAIAAAALLAIVVINGANVTARYIFISPFISRITLKRNAAVVIGVGRRGDETRHRQRR